MAHKLWFIPWLSLVAGFHDLRSLQKYDPHDILSLTIGGERSPTIYAFKPESLQERNLRLQISRKAASSVFYNDTLIICGGQSEAGDNRGELLNTCERFESGVTPSEHGQLKEYLGSPESELPLT